MISDYLNELTKSNLYIGSTIGDKFERYFFLRGHNHSDVRSETGDMVDEKVNNTIRHLRVSCIREVERKINDK